MKKRTPLVILAVFFACSSSVFAHQAKNVTPSYNAKSETLTVNIVHTTTRPNAHYIYKIEVEVNGRKVVEDENLGGQPDGNGRTYTTPLRGLKIGDTIKVTALCNRGGTKTGTIVVSETAASSSKTQSQSEPGPKMKTDYTPQIDPAAPAKTQMPSAPTKTKGYSK